MNYQRLQTLASGSDVDAASSVKNHTKARLNKDMQPSQFQRSEDRATSKETEATEVVTPQTETEAISREPGTSHNPIVIPDNAPPIIVDDNDGQHIIIDDVDPDWSTSKLIYRLNT